MVGDDEDGGARINPLQYFADELIGAPVHTKDGIAVLCRQRRVVHRMLRVEQPPHHVLHSIGRFDDADEQIPVARVDAAEDHLGAIVERFVEVVHERLLVHPPFVQRPRRLRPPERPVVAKTLEQIP
jgi:hypothetical protein